MAPIERGLGADLREFTDPQGRFDAMKIASVLDWEQREIARFLGKDPSTVSKNPAAQSYQDALARLVGLFRKIVELTSRSDVGAAVAWLRTPIWALDNQSPKALLIDQQMPIVERLVREYDTGFAS